MTTKTHFATVVTILSLQLSAMPLVEREGQPKKTTPELSKPAVSTETPSVGLDFSQCDPNYKGGRVGCLDGGTIALEVTLGGSGGPHTYKVEAKCDQGISDGAIALALFVQLRSIKGVSVIDQPGGLLQIAGTPDCSLQKVIVTLPGKTTNLITNTAGGAVCLQSRFIKPL